MNVGSFLEPYVVPYRCQPVGFGASKKNLLHVFGSEDDIASQRETIKVYLRLKPPNSQNDRFDLMDILDAHTLLVKTSSSSDHLVKRKTADCKYTFSKIFDTKTEQKEIFTECVHPLVTDFLNGQNCLLFSFGTTNAGKTYTIQGTGEQPGIIPRVLKMTFKSISGKLSTSNSLCPYQVVSALELTRDQITEIDDLKNKLLYWSQSDSRHGGCIASDARGSTEDLCGIQKFCEMQMLDAEVKSAKCDIDENVEVSIWVSFLEIYNERIFDLLDPYEKGKKRKELKLAQDPHKNNYVRDIRYIPVNSEVEAYKVLLFGKYNLQIQSTNINSSSNRSHCIFTIKLLKYNKLIHPDFVNVSSFSVCDLAGSERQKTTLNVGDRLKESQSINSSLHVLNRCFNIIRENQIKSEKQLIPYRDSKLTQLFKRALSGNENVTMIVNVSLSTTLFEETQYALKASAIAHQIIVQPKSRPKPSCQMSRFSQFINKNNGGGSILWDSSVKSNSSGERDKSTLESSQIQKLQEEVESLFEVIEVLEEKLKDKKDQLREEKQKNCVLEQNTRKQLTSEFQKILDDTELFYKNQLEVMIESKEKMFKSTIEIMQNCESHVELQNKRKRCDSKGNYTTYSENTESNDKLQVLQEEIEHLKDIIKVHEEEAQEELRLAQKKITGMTELLEANKREKTEMSLQISEMKFQYSLLQHENKKLQRTTEAVKSENIQALLDEIKQLKEIIKDRDELLDEARRDIEYEIKEKEQAETEVTSLETQLAEKDDIIEKLNADLDSMKQLLSIQTEKNEQLEERLDRYNKTDLQVQLADTINELNSKDVQISNLEKEVKTLLSKQKQEIQKNQDVKNKTANYDDLKRLKEKVAIKKEELKNAKSLIQELQESIMFKDVKLKSLQCKVESFEQTASILTAYKNEVEKKNIELEKANILASRQAAIIANLEQEIVTFQSNQKVINSKYDEQLRKCKEDVEREKRKAARLHETWLKLTPTPESKEEYIKRLEQQLVSLTMSEKNWQKNRSPCNVYNQENKPVSASKPKVVKNLIPQGVCTRSMKESVDDGITPLPDNIVNKQTKSTQKKGRQTPLSALSSNCDEKYSNYTSEQLLVDSSKKTQRKLYNNSDQVNTNDKDLEQIEEVPFTFHQSPNSVIKLNLQQNYDNQPS